MPQRAEYSVLRLGSSPLGILLHDPASGRLYQRLRTDVQTEDDDLFELLPEDLEAKAGEMGGEALLSLFEDTLSNSILISGRRRVVVSDFHAALDRLFEVDVNGVRPLRAGPVPLYSLRAAAGRFGEDMDAEPEGSVPAPAGVRPTPDMFAVHVSGHSMEPDIPDGAIGVFRYAPAGSRQGKRVLVWRRGASAGGGEFTLKVYESEKTATEDGWQHTRILLKPLNPDYPVLELDDEAEYRVLGEFVGVLGIDEI